MTTAKKSAEEKAEQFWNKYEIPFDHSACIKVRKTGLKRGSGGHGRARDTVIHLHVEEEFQDGRLSRSEDSYLCENDSHVFSQDEEPDLSNGLPEAISCETCLDRMERWKLPPEEWYDD